jgi:hypothetical protein
MFFSKKDKGRLENIEAFGDRLRIIERLLIRQLITQGAVEKTMSDIQEQIKEAAAAQEAESAAVVALKGVVDAVKAEVEAFIAANPAADTSGLQAVIDSAKAAVASIGEVSSEVEAIGAEVAPAPAPEPAPTEPA